MIKKILIIALNENWTGISRLPFGLERAGFDVFALCPKKSFLAKTRFLKDSILYPTFTYSRSKIIYLWMIFGILFFDPDLIVPGDEDTILALQNLSFLLDKIPFIFSKLAELIRNSLPSQEFDSIVLAKSEFQKKCQEWGIRTPKNIVVSSEEMAVHEAFKMGYPVVLKYDSGYGGSGVFICQSEADVRKYFSARRKFGTILKKIFFVSIFTIDNNISLQEYIDGDIGQAPFCAYKGLVYATNPMLRLKTYPGKTGPASVSRGFENEDIDQFVKIAAQKLCYTGFGSLEYMVEKKTQKLFVIELNPRPTPTCHMSSDIVTNDLCEMFYKGINSLPREFKKFTPYVVAMFPGEKRRDPHSPYLTENYHDIPLNDPELLKLIESK